MGPGIMWTSREMDDQVSEAIFFILGGKTCIIDELRVLNMHYCIDKPFCMGREMSSATG